jgi:hypothetical protein
VMSEETDETADQSVETTPPAPSVRQAKVTRIDGPTRQARTELHASGGHRQLPSADA